MQPKVIEAKKATHVTNRQGTALAKRARENGVLREEFEALLNDETRLKKFFDSLKTNGEWVEVLKAQAEKIGGQIHIIPQLKVNYARPHNEAAMAGGPQTGSDYNVLKVADKYQPEGEEVTEFIILFNFKNGNGSYKKAVEWGLENGLRKTTPHVPFAVGEQFPKLNYELGSNPMYVVETTGCSFDGSERACNVWWNVARRESSLCWQSSFGDSDGWFAFRK